MLFCVYRISTELIFEYVRIPIQEMAAENRAGPKAAYDISPEEVYQLNLLEAEEKVLYLRYVVLRESEPLKLMRYHNLLDLLEARISQLRQAS
jgi:hypothetical protein